MSPHESIIVDWIVGVELCHMKPKYCALCQHVIFLNGGGRVGGRGWRGPACVMEPMGGCSDETV